MIQDIGLMVIRSKIFGTKIDRQSHFRSAQVAFANLINRISGKGTWESNPYVFAYSFKLIK